MKPLFRWAGGKRRLIKHLLPLIGNPKGRYIEPFCGSAAIFFALEREGPSILNDVSKSIIKTFKGIATSPTQVNTYLTGMRKLQKEMGHAKFYELITDGIGSYIGGQASYYAARFLAVNQTSFNGLWRVNQSGGYNVPLGYREVGGNKVPYDVKLVELKDHSRLLKKATITCQDFRLIKLKRGDTTYLDPPYIAQFSAYAEGGFNLEDHADLYKWAQEQVKRGARVILSGAGHEMTEEVYGKPTLIIGRACTIGASNRKKTSEYIYVWE